MANSITSWNTFVPRTKIASAAVNSNFTSIKNLSPLWQKYTVDYTSFSALGATTTGAVTLFSITASDVLDAHIVKHSTAFSGTSITAATVQLGKNGDASAYTDTFDVLQAVSTGAAQLSQNIACEFSSTSFIVTMVVTGGLLNQLAAGSVDVYVRRAEIP